MLDTNSLSITEFSADEIQTLLDCLDTASPHQLEQFFIAFRETFPELEWAEDDLISILKAVLILVLQFPEVEDNS